MTNNFSFFFYDYESFGVDPARDRPAQFAGIRTDADFNLIGEPIMFYCRQTNDYLPSPEAVLVTGITPQLCNQKGLSEPEFAEKILAEFSQPNTCVIGYNNIRYDDEMTRYTFYRNFIDPYEYSWKHGNSRWDLLDLVRATYALRPDGIEWPYDDQGMPSFRLELLTKANDIAHQNAHDAMSDVYATIAMAKLIKQKQPKLFNYFFTNRGKNQLKSMIDLLNLTPLVHVSGMLGNERGNTTLIAPLAWHPTNQNAVIVCDLTGDIENLLQLSVEQIHQDLYTKKVELLEQKKSPIPLKLVHLNKCPILAPANTLLPKTAERLGIDRTLCLQNLERLKATPTIQDVVTEVFNQQPQFAPSNNVETELYNNFFSQQDKNNMAILRTLPAEKLANPDLSFQDPRIEKLLFHYRARHYFKTLTRAEQIKWQKYRHAKLDRSVAEFTQSLERLGEEYAQQPEKMALLEQLYIYGMQLLN
ncbi:exodeoxyribonuclease I [Mergibacter septicus]|uniref:Exodeoxyribonuclease I n=1 Tax=Mergibacter septicus TaxID=221402 RepID=A0A8D4LNN9_9PAST|nr:exodeoxyribonuclease I [Mergibacter septicus]AWX15021.1 exodeoxyribonuclease I [Mergibacter septicus]QDJ14273.1 exodeoxyribonuclease I [Mergibacter septicus]UTU48283.1 exodeoxyribonuclease I [Mergibacter septicus]WMR96096.1 exodeoxyribonuclease I [Mergibacter septicus]